MLIYGLKTNIKGHDKKIKHYVIIMIGEQFKNVNQKKCVKKLPMLLRMATIINYYDSAREREREREYVCVCV